MSDTPPAPGFVDSARHLGAGLLESVEDRLELFSLEIQEEKFRLIQITIVVSAAVLAGTMALVFLSLTVVYLFWESARLAVLAGLTGFYLLAFAAVVIAFRRMIARQPQPFPGLRKELAHDRECIRPES
jgi:uncharacterized membrane protein YqjE